MKHRMKKKRGLAQKISSGKLRKTVKREIEREARLLEGQIREC